MKGDRYPYRPSWFDSFTGWVEALAMSAWIFYVALGTGLILVQVLALWLEAGQAPGELLPVIIFNGFAVPFLLGQIHLLDNQAVAAVNSLRPILDTTEEEFEDYEYRLAHMPVLSPLVVGLLLAASVILSPLWSAEPVRYRALEQLPVSAAVYHVIDKTSAFLVGVFLYHTIRQLRLVSAINLGHVRVNLFRLSPLTAFSRLTASTAVGLVVFSYIWMLINPELLSDPVSIGLFAGFTTMAGALFVWPLYGVHRLMQHEKERALQDIDLLFEEVFSKFNRSFMEDDRASIEKLNATISSLEVQHRRVEAIPTWPWNPETARIALTAIALPLALTLLQFLAAQILGR